MTILVLHAAVLIIYGLIVFNSIKEGRELAALKREEAETSSSTAHLPQEE